jgi:hypothetical protein
MKPAYSEDLVLVYAHIALARAAKAVATTREHVDQSCEACERSRQLLRATVPVLPYRNDRAPNARR